MYDWTIKWTAKISEQGQAEGLPPEVHAYSFLFNSEPDQAHEHIKMLIDRESMRFGRLGGLPVEMIPAKLYEPDRLDPNRKLIPFAWIVELIPEPKFIGDFITETDEGKVRH